MKPFRFIPLLSSVAVGCIALAPAFAAMPVLSATPRPKVDSPRLDGPPIIASRKVRTGTLMNSLRDSGDQIYLTPTQKEEITSIQAGMASQLAAILTEQQLAAFRTAQGNETDMKQLMQGLDLSRRQRLDLLKVMQSTEAQIQTVLTPYQLEQLGISDTPFSE